MKRHYVLHADPGSYEVKGREATGSLGASYTGRMIDAEGGYAEAVAWRDLHAADPVDDRIYQERFLSDLSAVPWAGIEALVFRGRALTDPDPPRSCFGPPPQSRVRAGRYNAVGDPVLYLCSDVDAVPLEVPARPDNSVLWAQEFTISRQTLHIADLTSLPLDSFLAAVFWVAESWRESDRDGCGYRYSRKIAELVGKRFGGMLVPGVRGASDLLYSNLVIFQPGEEWRAWVGPGRPVRL